jgi:outer membrane murein-binding lipoprotein Lpp
MKKYVNFRSLAAMVIVGGSILLAGCSKESVEPSVGGNAQSMNGKKIKLSSDQAREVSEMYGRAPKLRFWDESHHRFIELKPGSRDLNFVDPDDGFNFDDPDGNGAMLYTDADGDYLVVSTGIGVAGQGGGGTVIAGSSALNIDIALCISAEEVAAGDGYGDIFGGDTGWTNFSAVFGISGDFEALANSDTGSENFDPFEYFYGFAVYYVFSDDLNGSYEVFDWLDEEEGGDDLEDFASSFVMDFTNFSLYFATDGEISFSGGMMTFNGTYLEIADLFDSFLEDDGLGDDEPEVNEVEGYGTMGCN